MIAGKRSQTNGTNQFSEEEKKELTETYGRCGGVATTVIFKVSATTRGYIFSFSCGW